MEPVIATMIMLGIIAIGEVFSLLSRAKIPMLLVAIIGVYILIQGGIIPGDIVDASTFTIVGAVLQPPLLVHMGTIIPMSVLKSQYKAVLITLIGLLFSVLFVLVAGTIVFNYGTAISGAGPLTGGIIATLITSEALREIGFTALASIPVIVLVLQGVLGMPLTSFFLRKHGQTLQKNIRTKLNTAATAETVSEVKTPEDILSDKNQDTKKALIPEKYLDSHFILLFLIFVGGAISVALDNLTGINYSLFGLGIGIIGAIAGFYPQNALEKANGFGIAMLGIIIIVIGSFVTTPWSDIVSVLPAAAFMIVVGTIGLLIGGYIGSKIFKWDPYLGMALTLTALYGFPGDYLITQEVSRSIGRDKEEQEEIFNQTLAPMLIGGFTSVTVGSVVIASILVQTL
ncbi:hypothetical protein SAMN05421676_102244 [Salinibacillus kushneri]|uniref:Uncharacterized protein n=1 Tax=Salinibacillus kushneri TaxID=237682 RepID=A0A1I0AUG2_9BACI|nr:hypothetical protein [Salinibacillus kushneri]SES97204.1 hypothetical protein SAMN05421676_102244 [Salinibacillus kushneri]